MICPGMGRASFLQFFSPGSVAPQGPVKPAIHGLDALGASPP
jgi:hypothetical protein